MSELQQHTPGPWRWEYNPDQKKLKLCGGRVRFDLTLMDFVRAGMNGAVARFRDMAYPDLNVMEPAAKYAVPEKGREHHGDWFRLIDHPDARLIELAPGLLAVCRQLAAVADVGDIVRVVDAAKAVIAKFEGRA